MHYCINVLYENVRERSTDPRRKVGRGDIEYDIWSELQKKYINNKYYNKKYIYIL